jgi:hypothetical protein
VGCGADLHGSGADVGQDCVEVLGELPGPVADQVPEVRSVITVHYDERNQILCIGCTGQIAPVPRRSGNTA